MAATMNIRFARFLCVQATAAEFLRGQMPDLGKVEHDNEVITAVPVARRVVVDAEVIFLVAQAGQLPQYLRRDVGRRAFDECFQRRHPGRGRILLVTGCARIVSVAAFGL